MIVNTRVKTATEWRKRVAHGVSRGYMNGETALALEGRKNLFRHYRGSIGRCNARPTAHAVGYSLVATPWLRTSLVTLSILFCFVCLSHAQQSKLSVRVHAQATLDADSFTLGDIAEVKSPDAMIAERLRGVALGYAPSVGTTRELARARIEIAVAAAGFDLATLRLEMPTTIKIKRASQFVDLGSVRAAIDTAVLADLRARGATARLARLDLPPAIEIPSGAFEIDVAAKNIRNPFVPFSVGLELRVGATVVRRLNVTAQVEASMPVLVASHDIAANARLTPQDFSLEPRILQGTASQLTDAKGLRGRAARRFIKQGEILSADMFVSPLVVKPGDIVRIEGFTDDGKVRVIVTGEARGSGRVGDRVQVRNTQSKSMLQAIVVDEGLVRVKF